MSLGLIGKKQGMTRLFTPEGDSFAVSVVSVNPNTITQIKSVEVDVITLSKLLLVKRR